MKIVKHAKHSLHTAQRRKRPSDSVYNSEIREGDTVCGVWLINNFATARRFWWGMERAKKIHVARCVRGVTCKNCLRNADVQKAITRKKPETEPSQK